MPVTVFSLQPGEAFAHLFEKVEVEGAELFVVCRQRLQDFRQSADYPTVAASPENLLVVGFFLSDVSAVAIEKVFVFIIQVVVCGTEFAVGKVHVFAVAGQRVEPRVDSGCHEKGVAPSPTFDRAAFAVIEVHASVGRIVQNPVGAGDGRLQHVFVLFLIIEIDVGLCDANVIGMIHPVGNLPVLSVEDFPEPVIIGVVSAQFRPVEHSHIKCSGNPSARFALGIFVFGIILDLPVRHPAGDVHDALPVPVAAGNNVGGGVIFRSGLCGQVVY